VGEWPRWEDGRINEMMGQGLKDGGWALIA
jgi:hypothetical protein